MITLIAAIDDNRVIGFDDKLPWHLPEDFRHFKETTLGHPIIMGRKTYESLPKRPLPHRTNIVVSRSGVEGVDSFSTIDDAIDYAQTLSGEVFVIGGQSVYEQTINKSDRLLITHVEGSFEGNYWFPEIDEGWNIRNLIKTGDGFTIFEYFRG